MAFCVAVMAKSFLKVAQIFGGQKFSPASFWRNLLKTKFFRRQVSFIVAYIWSIILSWASHYQLADVICIVSSIPSLARFSFFTNFRPKKNCAKNEFSTDFLQNLKFKRVSMLQGLAYHMNRKTVLLRFKKKSSDSSLHFERVFLFGFFAENGQTAEFIIIWWQFQKILSYFSDKNLNRNS